MEILVGFIDMDKYDIWIIEQVILTISDLTCAANIKQLKYLFELDVVSKLTKIFACDDTKMISLETIQRCWMLLNTIVYCFQ